MGNSYNRQFAVVTGASSGIGYELAAQFARNGLDLLIASESDRIREAAEKLGEVRGSSNGSGGPGVL